MRLHSLRGHLLEGGGNCAVPTAIEQLFREEVSGVQSKSDRAEKHTSRGRRALRGAEETYATKDPS